MNTGYFLAKRLVSRSKGNFSRTFVAISVTSITLGLTVMFVAVAILTGFKKEIREKVSGFSGHIQITRFSENQTFEPSPIEKNQPFYEGLKQHKDIRHIQVFASKAGIIKTRDQIQGVALKGIGPDYDWGFFRDKMKEGKIFSVSDTGRNDSVIISDKTARALGLHVNDDLRVYFIAGEHTLGRKFKISGIFDTGLEEFDKLYIIGDIHHIRKLNQWAPGQVGGFEVTLNDFDDMEPMGRYIYQHIGFSLDATTIRQLYPQIFDWLDLQDINVLIILILIFLVSATTIISTLLILILERTRMIGILKALGMRNSGIRKVFLYHAFYIIGWGLFWGNLISFTLCLAQKQFGLIKLPEESYYVSVIPIYLNLWNILLLNGGVLLACYLIFIVPSLIITRISPVKAIRFS